MTHEEQVQLLQIAWNLRQAALETLISIDTDNYHELLCSNHRRANASLVLFINSNAAIQTMFNKEVE